jgi:WD40 repeat protein
MPPDHHPLLLLFLISLMLVGWGCWVVFKAPYPQPPTDPGTQPHQPQTKRRIIAALVGIVVLVSVYILWLMWPDPRLLYTVKVSSPLFHVAVSSDGQLLATSALNGDVQLWNAAGGAPLRTIQGHSGEAALAFSPDSRWLVSAGYDGTVRLWDVATGRLLHMLWPYPPDPRYALTERRPDGAIITLDERFASAAFSPDGSLIAVGSEQGRVVLLHPDGPVWQIIRTSVETQTTSEYPVTAAFVSHDNQLLLAASLDGVRLWHLPEQRLIKYFRTDTTSGLLYSPGYGQFSPDSTTIRTFDGPGGELMTSAVDDWSRDGRLLTPSPGKFAADLDFVFFKGGATATSFAVSRDMQILAWGGGTWLGEYHNVSWIGGQNDPRIIVWRVGQAQPAYTLGGHEDNVTDLAFSPDGTFLASVGYDHTLRVWRLSE